MLIGMIILGGLGVLGLFVLWILGLSTGSSIPPKWGDWEDSNDDDHE